jgi:hypothetical protein
MANDDFDGRLFLWIQDTAVRVHALESIIRGAPFNVSEERMKQALEEAENILLPPGSCPRDLHSAVTGFLSRATRRESNG